ncbi:MAG: hypothetical protein ACOCRK_10980 [bacterium]
MKKIIVLSLIMMVLFSSFVFAEDDFARRQKDIVNRSFTYFQSGYFTSGLEHNINNEYVKLNNDFSTNFIYSGFNLNFKLNNLIKEVNFNYGSNLNINELEFEQNYKTTDYLITGNNGSDNLNYSNLDINLILEQKFLHYNLGLGYENQEQEYILENGFNEINDDGSKSKESYTGEWFNYKLTSEKPYIYLRFSNYMKDNGGEELPEGYYNFLNKIFNIAIDGGFKVYPYITATNEIQYNNNELLTTDFKGFGLDYEQNWHKPLGENLFFNIGYNYKYMKLENEESSNKELINQYNLPVNTSDLKIEEEIKQSIHIFKAGLTLHF